MRKFIIILLNNFQLIQFNFGYFLDYDVNAFTKNVPINGRVTAEYQITDTHILTPVCDPGTIWAECDLNLVFYICIYGDFRGSGTSDFSVWQNRLKKWWQSPDRSTDPRKDFRAVNIDATYRN